MEAIGRILAYVLLAAAFTRNVLATSAANVKFSRDSDKIARFNAAKVEFVPEPAPLNSDVSDLRSIPVSAFESKPVQDIKLGESRTFGHKRIQFMLMPMMYKMGVMMTMLMIITVIAAKGLLVGLMVLVLKLSTFLAKLHSGWHTPQPWVSPQPVHLYVHSAFPHVHPQMYQSWESPSSGYDLGYEDPYYYKG